MTRVAAFVDGFNLYHSLIANPRYRRYKWLDVTKLIKCLMPPTVSIAAVYHFTAYTTWDMDKVNRHKLYVRALQSTGVKIVLGAFRRKDRVCLACRKTYETFEEKQTDVNISITLFKTAIEDTWDTALIVSGDSDLIPAIEAVKASFPSKKIGVIIPIGRRAEELKQIADFHVRLKEKHLASCLFPVVIELDGEQKIERPDSWK